mgnify:CR=1 FL=1
MANKLYAMELLTEEVAKDVAANPQAVPVHFSGTALDLCTASGSNSRGIHGNLEPEDVPMD